jgi:hypothetical protein
MLRYFERTRERAVEFCDGCSAICTAADRREAILARSRDTALALGGRFV